MTQRINEFANECRKEDAEFGYVSTKTEIANQFWIVGLTGDERIQLSAEKKGGNLAQIRAVVRDLTELIAA